MLAKVEEIGLLPEAKVTFTVYEDAFLSATELLEDVPYRWRKLHG